MRRYHGSFWRGSTSIQYYISHNFLLSIFIIYLISLLGKKWWFSVLREGNSASWGGNIKRVEYLGDCSKDRPSGKLTSCWLENGSGLKKYFLWKMGNILASYVILGYKVVVVVVSEFFSSFFNLKPWGNDRIRRAHFANGLKSPTSYIISQYMYIHIYIYT